MLPFTLSVKSHCNETAPCNTHSEPNGVTAYIFSAFFRPLCELLCFRFGYMNDQPSSKWNFWPEWKNT